MDATEQTHLRLHSSPVRLERVPLGGECGLQHRRHQVAVDRCVQLDTVDRGHGHCIPDRFRYRGRPALTVLSHELASDGPQGQREAKGRETACELRH